MPATQDAVLRDLLSLKRVAVIGCSSTPGKAAHEVPAYLQRHGFEVFPVNPFAGEVLGVSAYDSLGDIDQSIELVNVFRPSEEVAGIVDEVLSRAETHGDVRGLWLQLGIIDDAALERAEAAGLITTQDRCMKVEHRRLLGGE